MPESKIVHFQEWQILRSQTVYDYPPFIKLVKQTVELSDGKIVDDYHSLEMPDYCLVIAFCGEQGIITLRGYRHGLKEVTTFLPGGLIHEDESPLSAARRELVEESGYQAEKWTSIGTYIPNSNYGCGRVHLFQAIDAKKTHDPVSDDLENMVVEVIDLDTIRKWVRENQILSLSSVAAIALAMAEVF